MPEFAGDVLNDEESRTAQRPSLPRNAVRPARALPYELHVRGEVAFSEGAVKIRFGNSGKAAAGYQVYCGDGQSGPWTYTVGLDAEISETWSLTGSSPGHGGALLATRGYFFDST